MFKVMDGLWALGLSSLFGAACSCLPMLFAQAPAGVVDWTTLAKDFGVVIALAWYLYYTQAVAIPQQQKTNNDWMQMIIDNYRNDISRLVQDFRDDLARRDEEIRLIREGHERELQLLRETFQCHGAPRR